jgi:hypothetical protein
MLARYRIFSRMGAFGVDLDSPRGAAAFIRVPPGRVVAVDHHRPGGGERRRRPPAGDAHGVEVDLKAAS